MLENFSLTYLTYFVIGLILIYYLVFLLAIYLRRYFDRLDTQRIQKLAAGTRGYFISAAFGAITPFCSCTTVPIFVGLVDGNIRLGYAISFLIASPTINPPAIILLLALFGWKFQRYTSSLSPGYWMIFSSFVPSCT